MPKVINLIYGRENKQYLIIIKLRQNYIMKRHKQKSNSKLKNITKISRKH